MSLRARSELEDEMNGRLVALWKDIVRDPGSYIMLVVFALIVLASLYVIFTTSAATWRHQYCTASEAQAIECTVKGWW